jgi:predicted TIM-barrel fold metal-dependent hydrolase
MTRRQILAMSAACGFATLVRAANAAKLQAEGAAQAATTQSAATRPDPNEPIIDVHQHTNYHKRTDERLLVHQRNMGVTRTILLPGGTPVDLPSTHKGKANGLYAGAGVTETCEAIVRQLPGEYSYFVNEVPDLPGAADRLKSFLARGAIGIGEQKFNLPCDSKEMELIYDIARDHKVPVLMHFQYEMFNTGYENFEKVLKKYADVNFIGHAQAFWSNIDQTADVGTKGYPKGKITAGGLTDRYMSDYPNLYADTSAYSGLSAMIRDEDHYRGFIERHPDQICFGSDCPDNFGHGPTCTGSSLISAIRRLSSSKAVERKLLHDNAKRLLKL